MNKSKIVLSIIPFSLMLFSGCSSVPLEPKGISDKVKTFNSPETGKAGIYIYRDSFVGQALKKDLFIDNKCLGETANKVFFYKSVEGDKEHRFSTESEFSANSLSILTNSGKNYYIRQYIKMGVFVGGAALEQVSAQEGKKVVSNLSMAKEGTCSRK